MTGTPSTAVADTTEAESNSSAKKPSKSIPPAVITVDTNAANSNTNDDHDNNKDASCGHPSEGKGTPEEKSMGQARTPKHANKGRDEDNHHYHNKDPQQPQYHTKQQITPDRSRDIKAIDQQYGGNNGGHERPVNGPPRPPYGGFSPPRPYEGRPLGGSGAFQPHESRQPGRSEPPPYYNGHGRPPMHVSPPHGPSHGDYRPGYYGGPPDFHRGGGGPGGYSHYDHQRYGHEGPPPPPPGYRGPPPPGGQYRGPPYPPSYSGYDQGNNPNAWGGPPYGHRRPPPYPGMAPVEYHHQRQPANTQDARYNIEPQQPPGGGGGTNTFSRAVSSSFGSRTDEKPAACSNNSNHHTNHDQKMNGSHRDQHMDQHRYAHSHAAPPQREANPPPLPQEGSLGEHSDDNSWRQLNQVASVDEAVMRERMESKETESRNLKVDHHLDTAHHHHHHPASNSSSLTNSPTEAHAVEAAAKRAASIPTPSKLASLDSLSSVASAQEPLTTTGNKDKTAVNANISVGHLSPGSSASLDLMKCSSGSSGLLHLASQNLSFLPPDPRIDIKRSRDEERGDADASKPSIEETRRAPSDPSGKLGVDPRPTKRGRHDNSAEVTPKDPKFKESPLSIVCSPPQSPAAKGRNDSRRKPSSAQQQAVAYPPIPTSKQERFFHQSPGQLEGSYFDKAPSYTYSMDSAPPLPKDNQRPAGYLPLPHRPGSSSSSTITPMQVEGNDANQPNGVGPSLPSWEIQQQDSFSGGSAGGGAPLMNSFSFSQDYPMLSSSGSNLGNYADHGNVAMPPLAPTAGGHANSSSASSNHQAIESRNQSFEGGHYHGSFSRSESMDMSYGSSRPPHGPYNDNFKSHHHHPGYIHHAPSWGSHGPPPGPQGHYGQYPRVGHSASFSQGGPGPMMRNYSEERVSPPPGPPGMRGGSQGRPGFQPPPEFMAPHNPHLATRRPQQTVYLMSSPPGGHGSQSKVAGGSFAWSKEDDIRLTEIMKKYKNPRDWEPIAKEHGRGRTQVPIKWLGCCGLTVPC